MPVFSLTVGPSSLGSPNYELIDWSSWSIDENLDNGCSIRFEALGNSDAARSIDELATDAWLYQDGTAIGRFRLVKIDQTWGPSGEDTISCEGVCYRRMLGYRTVQSTLTYTGVSQGQIVWNLINHTQSQTNGNLGITLGTIGSTTARDREYLPGKNILEAITEFTKISGPLAWDITPAGLLNVYDPTSFSTVIQPIVLGVNARGLSRPSSADKFANASLVIGNTLSAGPIAGASATLATDSRGRWEKVFTVSNETDLGNLQEYADGLVDETLSPAATWRVDIEPSMYFDLAAYAIGDYVQLAQPRSTVYSVGVAAPTVTCQVIARTVAQDASGNVTVSLSLIEIPV